MHGDSAQVQSQQRGDGFVLGVDTCGPSGSVALGRLDSETLQILGQAELAGRTYSARLVAAVGELLAQAGTQLSRLDAMVVVNGPGSFTGVRVGVSAVKGLAEPAAIPVLAVSRLAVLASKAGCVSAALDAHRHEVFLRVPGPDGNATELLAGQAELLLTAEPAQIAICDDSAPELLQAAWPRSGQLRVPAPTAADALRLAIPDILTGRFVDLVLLDGHYLRRSDAEIFGEAASKPKKTSGLHTHMIRKMAVADLDAVMALAQNLPEAPVWTGEAYRIAVDAAALPQRIALVAEDAGGVAGFVVARVTVPEAELETVAVAAPLQRRGIAKRLFADLAGELRRQRVTEVSLEVRASNAAARSFYGSLGFVESGRRPRYYADPVEDAVLMRFRLA